LKTLSSRFATSVEDAAPEPNEGGDKNGKTDGRNQHRLSLSPIREKLDAIGMPVTLLSSVAAK
jgi:hypothetical protein